MFVIPANGECTTIGDEPCVFPFKYRRNLLYRRKTFYACTVVGAEGEYPQPWCSTKVDRNGRYVSGNWHYCAPGCPGVDGKGRIFCVIVFI